MYDTRIRHRIANRWRSLRCHGSSGQVSERLVFIMKKTGVMHCSAMIVVILLLLSFSSPVFAESKGWRQEGVNIRYYTGTDYVKNKVRKIGKHYYYFDRSGNRQTGWVKWNGHKYYFSPDTGIAYTGAETVNGKLYLFRDDGRLISGSQTKTHRIGDEKYVIDSRARAYEFKAGYITKSTLKKKGIDKCRRLMIVAHPDDESYWGSGHLQKYGGYFVVCLTNSYNPTRKQAFEKSLKLNGAKGIILPYPDLSNGEKVVWDEDTKARIRSDIWTVVTYKKWKNVATHNPDGEYGHIHHKLTSRLVTQVCDIYGIKNKLWYFGKYYSKAKLETKRASLKSSRIAKSYLDKKNYLLSTVYGAQKVSVETLSHMAPYENWIKAASWK